MVFLNKLNIKNFLYDSQAQSLLKKKLFNTKLIKYKKFYFEYRSFGKKNPKKTMTNGLHSGSARLLALVIHCKKRIEMRWDVCGLCVQNRILPGADGPGAPNAIPGVTSIGG